MPHGAADLRRFMFAEIVLGAAWPLSRDIGNAIVRGEGSDGIAIDGADMFAGVEITGRLDFYDAIGSHSQTRDS